MTHVQRVDGQNAGEGIDLHGFDFSTSTGDYVAVDHPADRKRRITFADGTGERQALAQPQRRIHLERRDLGRHCNRHRFRTLPYNPTLKPFIPENLVFFFFFK